MNFMNASSFLVEQTKRKSFYKKIIYYRIHHNKFIDIKYITTHMWSRFLGDLWNFCP